MTKVSMSTKLNASADQVWSLIGGFNALPDWLPPIEKSELEEDGQTRRLSLVGGGTVIEKQEKIDENERSCTYSIVDSPLPLNNYLATLKAIEDDDGCTVDWSSQFDPAGATEDEAADVVRGIYQAGFDSLKKTFGAG
jgi:hypothetical protein